MDLTAINPLEFGVIARTSIFWIWKVLLVLMLGHPQIELCLFSDNSSKKPLLCPGVVPPFHKTPIWRKVHRLRCRLYELGGSGNLVPLVNSQICRELNKKRWFRRNQRESFKSQNIFVLCEGQLDKVKVPNLRRSNH